MTHDKDYLDSTFDSLAATAIKMGLATSIAKTLARRIDGTEHVPRSAHRRSCCNDHLGKRTTTNLHLLYSAFLYACQLYSSLVKLNPNGMHTTQEHAPLHFRMSTGLLLRG